VRYAHEKTNYRISQETTKVGWTDGGINRHTSSFYDALTLHITKKNVSILRVYYSKWSLPSDDTVLT